jgi:hypothetical protein
MVCAGIMMAVMLFLPTENRPHVFHSMRGGKHPPFQPERLQEQVEKLQTQVLEDQNERLQKGKLKGDPQHLAAAAEEAVVNPDLVVHVLTMNRRESLLRLLRSLEGAHYPPGTSVSLKIHIDVTVGTNEADAATVAAASEAAWSHGSKLVHVWPAHVGLIGNWVDCWQPETEPAHDFAVNLILEDDLEVSPFYADWFLRAVKRFEGDQSVFSVSGMRPQLVASDGGPMAPHLSPSIPVIKYRLLGTWSMAPIRQAWVQFRAWFQGKRRTPGYIPSVPNTIVDAWYREFIRRGTQENMWEMWAIAFTAERRQYTPTLKC